MRDDFSAETKDLISRRVGVKCSNPNCRRTTSGPQSDPKGTINVGVAAHITAASKGGPRFDRTITQEERKSDENGIWLCQTCAKLIDNDEGRYSADLLRQWKSLSERAALMDIEAPALIISDKPIPDKELIAFYAQCFDRPAFQDHFRQEGSTEAFDKAIEDTLTAINTGCLRSRDGQVLSMSKGKAFLQNHDWRRRMDAIADILISIRSTYADARLSGAIKVSGRDRDHEFYMIHDPEIADWMDHTRSKLLSIFGEVCRDAGITPPIFPRRFRAGL